MSNRRKSNLPVPLPETVELPEIQGRVAVVLAFVETAADLLMQLPPPEAALRDFDPERHQWLAAAEAMKGWILGQGARDTTDRPGRDSALGEAASILAWSEVERRRHLEALARDISERN